MGPGNLRSGWKKIRYKIILVKRERLYESIMRAAALAAWAEVLRAHILASAMNKKRTRNKKKRKMCGAWMWCSFRMKMKW